MEINVEKEQNNNNFNLSPPSPSLWVQMSAIAMDFQWWNFTCGNHSLRKNIHVIAHNHPAGSSMNSAICEDISKFCPSVSQWEGYFSCSFSVEYPQISKSSEIYPLFGQCSSDAQLVAFNYIQILKDNIGKNHRNLSIFTTMCFFQDQ